MPDPSTLLSERLQRWYDLRQQGQTPPLEELCADCPHLLDQLRQHIQDQAKVEALLHQVNTGTIPATTPPGPPTLPATAPASATPQPVPGYEILGVLGRGAMGVVYQARQLKAQRLVALKMILAGGHASPEELARFQVEAQAVARLQHPGIVQIFEVGEHDGRPFFSLEFCAGGSLNTKLAGTPLPPTEAVALVEKLAQAMQAAHDKGVLHRDLKPANVLLSAEGQPKIADFGLAKKLDEAGRTATGAVMGTPSYMAPEQAEGQKALGPAVDVYALGAILYECLTGRPPFRGPTTLDTLMLVVGQEPVPVRQLQPAVPRDLETICHKCLHKEPARRFASAAALAEDLRRFQAGEPILARSLGLIGRLRWWVVHPNRIRDAGIVSVFVMMLITTWVLLGLGTHAVSAWRRGSTWPFANARIPGPADLAVIHLAGLLGVFFLPLFFIGLFAVRRQRAAIWLGLLVSLANLSLLIAFLAGWSPLLDWIDLNGLLRTYQIRFFVFSFPIVLMLLVFSSYLIALLAQFVQTRRFYGKSCNLPSPIRGEPVSGVASPCGS
jgi:serine/threonine protein kinase